MEIDSSFPAQHGGDPSAWNSKSIAITVMLVVLILVVIAFFGWSAQPKAVKTPGELKYELPAELTVAGPAMNFIVLKSDDPSLSVGDKVTLRRRSDTQLEYGSNKILEMRQRGSLFRGVPDIFQLGDLEINILGRDAEIRSPEGTAYVTMVAA